MLLWWICQWLIAHRCGLQNHLHSFHRGMFKLNVKFDADSLLYVPSHFKCDSHTIHMLTHSVVSITQSLVHHWLVQWSCHCSHMHVPVHFSLAAKLHQCCANLLTMAGIFADRPHVYMCVYVSVYKLWPFEIILFFLLLYMEGSIEGSQFNFNFNSSFCYIIWS